MDLEANIHFTAWAMNAVLFFLEIRVIDVLSRMTVSFSLVTKVCIIPGENEEWFECSCVFNLLLVKKDVISQA